MSRRRSLASPYRRSGTSRTVRSSSFLVSDSGLLRMSKTMASGFWLMPHRTCSCWANADQTRPQLESRGGPQFPALRAHLPLTDAEVGYALLFFAVGAVAGATAARFVLARGARSFVRAGTPALCVALVTPGLAGNLAELMGGFLLIGVCSGLLDVLENAQGAELERLAARPLINGFHAFWSLGALMRSVAARLAAYFGIPPLTQFAATAVIVAPATAWFLRELPDTRSGAAGATPAGARPLWLGRRRVAGAARGLG